MTGGFRRAICGATLLALPGAALAQRVIDGQNIPTDNADALAVVTQRYQTGFGDNPGNRFSFGSELNQMFIAADASNLYVAISGNLENNGNGAILFIDTVDDDPAGAQLATRPFGLANPNLPRNLAGNPFDAGEVGFNQVGFDDGFFPEFALNWNGGSPLGSRTRTYYLVNWCTLVPNDPNDAGNDSEVAGLMTDGDPTASGTAGTLGSFGQTSVLGILGASDNSNAVGVSGGFPSQSDPNLVGDPSSATTGFEFAIPLSAMGVSGGDTIRLFAVVTGTGGFISNQMLPPPDPNVSPEFNNIGGGRPFTFADVPGQQYVEVTLPGAGCPGDIDGMNGTDLNDLLILLGTFGDPGGPADLDGMNGVDLNDLLILLGDFGCS